MTTIRPPSLIGAAATLILLAGCTAGATTPEPAAVAPAPSATAPSATALPATALPATATSPAASAPTAASAPARVVPARRSDWGSGPVTVTHRPSLPVPVLTRVRYAAHPGFDRIVFDIAGDLPGYSARYVDEVRSDGSGEPVAVPGRRFLLVVLNPAQAHRDYQATVSGVHRTNLANLKAYAIAGDYEGYVSIALGLDDVVGYRIRELPGRIYVDVAA